MPQPDRDYEEAIALLANGGSPADGRRAVELIELAAARGHPAAIERLALFEATGVGRPLDWNRALDRLAEAAALGMDAAKSQLLVLADPEGSAAAVTGDGWAAVRRLIDIGKRLSCPAAAVKLSSKPWVRTIERFATAAECRWIVGLAQGRQAPADVVTGDGTQVEMPVRTNSKVAFQLAQMDVLLEVLRARIAAACRLPLPLFESTQVLHYAPGQEFRPHRDYLDEENPAHRRLLGQAGQRIATVLVYLNDGYGGGETDFPLAGLAFKGKVGDALILANVDRAGRPDPSTLHAGCPPTDGEKWILSQWIRDRPQG